MDDGYWNALLRDVDEEVDPPAAGPHAAEPSAGTGAVSFGQGARRSPATDPDSETDWHRAEGMLASGETRTVRVSGFNRGGLLADFGSLQGFIPASHLLAVVLGQHPEQRAATLAARIGDELVVRVAEIDRERCRLILSERLACEDGHAETVIANLRPGDTCRGRVTSLCPFGAFVDLGGFEGLVHISELSWGRIGTPGEIVQPGEQLDLLVLEVNPDAHKIALSLKRLRPDPWHGVESRYEAGQVVDAVITNVVNFGAFARLEEGLEGLIHVSELAEGTFMHPRGVIREGDHVRARILQVDGSKRRIALTLRASEGGLRGHTTAADAVAWER